MERVYTHFQQFLLTHLWQNRQKELLGLSLIIKSLPYFRMPLQDKCLFLDPNLKSAAQNESTAPDHNPGQLEELHLQNRDQRSVVFFGQSQDTTQLPVHSFLHHEICKSYFDPDFHNNITLKDLKTLFASD